MYECHITINQGKERRDYLKQMVESVGWKFSAIDGDPVLGEGVKCYGTKYFKSSDGIVSVLNILESTADSLRGLGLDVIRTKVEFIVYDSRR